LHYVGRIRRALARRNPPARGMADYADANPPYDFYDFGIPHEFCQR
jgi:hypothetical protein